MSCSTSSILTSISTFRNPEADATKYNCGHVALAQLGYIAMIPFAIVEAAIGQIAKAFAHCVHLNPEKCEKISGWAGSSAAALLWTVHSVAVNFFVVHMCTTENQFSISILKKDPKNPNPLPGPNRLDEIRKPDPEPKPGLGPQNIPLRCELPLPAPRPVPTPVHNLVPRPVPNPDLIGQNSPPTKHRNLELPPTPNRPFAEPKPVANHPVKRQLQFEGLIDDALGDEEFETLMRLNALQEGNPAPADRAGQKPGEVDTGVKPVPVLPPDPPKPFVKLDRIKAPFAVENQIIDLRVVEGGVREIVESYKVGKKVAKLLENYELGDSAKSYTEIYDRICRELPDPTTEQVFELAENLRAIGVVRTDGWSMQTELIKIVAEMTDGTRSSDNERFIKMLFSIWNAFAASNDSLEKAIMQGSLNDADTNCIVRKNDEIQLLFLKYVAPRYNINISHEDCLVFAYMQERIKIRENLLRILDCTNTHDRSFYSKELNPFFYLPKPSIVVEEGAPWDNARKEMRIKIAFRQCYNTTNAIYSIFMGLVNPILKDKSSYKAAFFLEWIQANHLEDEALEDDGMTYKPELLIRYLVETGFLQKK